MTAPLRGANYRNLPAYVEMSCLLRESLYVYYENLHTPDGNAHGKAYYRPWEVLLSTKQETENRFSFQLKFN